MRWKNFFGCSALILIFGIFPLFISIVGKIQKRLYGCSYDVRCDASFFCGATKINCENNHRLADYIAQLIDFGLYKIITIPISLYLIVMLVFIQLITLLVKFHHRRNRHRSN